MSMQIHVIGGGDGTAVQLKTDSSGCIQTTVAKGCLDKRLLTKGLKAALSQV